MRTVTSPPVRSLIRSPVSPHAQPFTRSSLIFLYSNFPLSLAQLFLPVLCSSCSPSAALPLYMLEFPIFILYHSFHALIPPPAHAPIYLKCILAVALACLLLPSPRNGCPRASPCLSETRVCQPTDKLQLHSIINIVRESEVQVGDARRRWKR